MDRGEATVYDLPSSWFASELTAAGGPEVVGFWEAFLETDFLFANDEGLSEEEAIGDFVYSCLLATRSELYDYRLISARLCCDCCEAFKWSNCTGRFSVFVT